LRHPAWEQILIPGGRGDGTNDNTADLYDPASNRFASEIATPRMKGREWETATVLVSGPNAGKVLLAGGDNTNGIPRASTELYDPATNTVVNGPAMKMPRSGHTATPIPSGRNAGKILLAGGTDADGSKLSSTELYNPASNTFSPGPVMGAACSLCTATVITSGKNAGRVLIANHYDSGGQGAQLELYDPAADKFIAGPRTSMLGVYSATAISSGKNAGKVLIVGAIDTTDKASQAGIALAGLYDPDANTFSPGPSVRNIRNFHTATVITSGPNAGKILIAGGGDGLDDPRLLASTELYDPDSNVFSPGPSMNTGRARHTATPILSGRNAGKILIAGGVKSVGKGVVAMLSSTELYDPVANKFAPPGDTPEMNELRSDTVAVQLPPAP
jgi:galactose oxidase-like protein/Kelch motif protein